MDVSQYKYWNALKMCPNIVFFFFSLIILAIRVFELQSHILNTPTPNTYRCEMKMIDDQEHIGKKSKRTFCKSNIRFLHTIVPWLKRLWSVAAAARLTLYWNCSLDFYFELGPGDTCSRICRSIMKRMFDEEKWTCSAPNIAAYSCAHLMIAKG